MRKKTVLGVTFSKLIGLALFLIVLAILNIIELDNSISQQVLDFLNQNLWVIIIFSVLFYFAELFSVFRFPFNVPAPVFNALGGIFLVVFIFQMLYAIGDALNLGAFATFRFFEPLAYSLVFVIVLIAGYIMIIIDLAPKQEEEKLKSTVKPKKGIEWSDVGNEFKMALYNLASTIKERLEPKKSQKKN